MNEISRENISLPKRPSDSHKGDFGRALLICGSKKYTGASFFSAQAAVNTGCGLVFLSVPKEIRPIMASKLNEPILIGRRNISVTPDAELIGCGLGLSRGSLSLVRRRIFKTLCPLVIDADAITVISRSGIDISKSPRTLILTPHEGEFRRLVPDFDNARREEFAANFANQNGCILVLKGHRTVTASPDGQIFLNTSGNSGMAKGGSGDVLAGIITSLVAQGISPLTASYTGVWLHGTAGDLAAEKYGEYSMTPTDMLYSLKTVIRAVQNA